MRRQGRCFVGIGAGRSNRTRGTHRKTVTFIEAVDVVRWARSRRIRSRRRTDDRSDGATQEHGSNEELQTATQDLQHGARPWAAPSWEELFRAARVKSSWTVVHWTEVQCSLKLKRKRERRPIWNDYWPSVGLVRASLRRCTATISTRMEIAIS